MEHFKVISSEESKSCKHDLLALITPQLLALERGMKYRENESGVR